MICSSSCWPNAVEVVRKRPTGDQKRKVGNPHSTDQSIRIWTPGHDCFRPKALFAHRAHLVFVRGSLQVGATPACCSAVLLVRTYSMGGFENQTCVGLPPCFIFISEEITSTTDVLSHHPSLACTVACTIPTVAHGYLRPRRAFLTPLRLCHVVLFY